MYQIINSHFNVWLQKHNTDISIQITLPSNFLP